MPKFTIKMKGEVHEVAKDIIKEEQSDLEKFTVKMKGDAHEVSNTIIQGHKDIVKEETSDHDGPHAPSNIDRNREDQSICGSTHHDDKDSTAQQVIEVSSSECSTDDDEDTRPFNDSDKQLVLYDPSVNGDGAIEAVPESVVASKPKPLSRLPFQGHAQRVLPSVGAFTVQCANCFKWRLIPNQEKYEEIREHITEQPFVCETAREWRPDITCDDPADITQDGSRLWAIDKPNIAQPPRGWQRLLRIRGEGSTKFADVYYTAPTGMKLRSIPDVEKYLQNHPEFVEQGVNLSQFSFQIPKPLQTDYVRKRPTRVPAAQASPIAWAGPEDTDLHLGMPGLSDSYLNTPGFDPMTPPTKKARSTPSKRRCNFDFVYKHQQL